MAANHLAARSVSFHSTSAHMLPATRVTAARMRAVRAVRGADDVDLRGCHSSACNRIALYMYASPVLYPNHYTIE